MSIAHCGMQSALPNRTTKPRCHVWAFLGTIDAMLKLSHTKNSGRSRSGQAMVEYVIVFVAMLAFVAVLSVFLYAVRQQSNRALDLVASEYP